MVFVAYTVAKKMRILSPECKFSKHRVYEGMDRHLRSLQESIRVQRKDAVQPQVAQVTAAGIRLSLRPSSHAPRKKAAYEQHNNHTNDDPGRKMTEVESPPESVALRNE